ncbi:MAG: tRNA 2-thiouridine(34) synthase MnmA [Actinobacteria bacterium]|nr:tRNA 2-thiouridine(34) synthase MnmA [Actinomycetota bacterium]MCL6104979.1 tRNA 2-thiouridine(34) synthase MnmA [Actinomycetota bacterium]
MKILVAMSGGVDSSVAAALLLEQGYEVVGVTLKLLKNSTESGCCSLKDVEDADQVANRLGIDHHVFNFTEVFEKEVIFPYVDSHAHGVTLNPCISCNTYIKFDRLLERAIKLGFDALATGHYARVAHVDDHFRLLRAADTLKDQSYVLSTLNQHQLEHSLFPVGSLKKDEVRAYAKRLKLPTAEKHDSQGVCFLSAAGIQAQDKLTNKFNLFSNRIRLHRGKAISLEDGSELGEVSAIELLTIGQRKGVVVENSGHLGGSGCVNPMPTVGSATNSTGVAPMTRRYVVSMDHAKRKVFMGTREQLMVKKIELSDLRWIYKPIHSTTQVMAQSSAHSVPRLATFDGVNLHFVDPICKVAPGQIIAMYECRNPDTVIGCGIVAGE